MDRTSPFQEIEQILDQFSQQFEGLEPSQMGGGLAVDVADLGDAYEVTADVPGFDSEDIEVTLPDSRTVHITAERETATDEEETAAGRTFIRQERRRQSASRTVSLPDHVAESEADATHDNGVLTVTLPKRTPDEETEIPVS